jgi:hypothetical protein
MSPLYLRSRTIPAFLLASGFFLASCSPKLAPAGHYQDVPVVADGQTDDWQLPLRFSDAHYALQYNVTNDNKNFYICVISTDVHTQMRMLKDGLTIYFDPKGDQNKDISLHFPMRKPSDPVEDKRFSAGEPSPADSRKRREELLFQSDNYGTTGFLDIENGNFGVADARSPVRVAIKLNQQDSILVYEAIIPIGNVMTANWQARAARKNFSVGIALNPLSLSRPAYNDRPHGGGGRGMGMGINGMHGAGHRSGGGPAQPAPKEDDEWYKFRLSTR